MYIIHEDEYFTDLPAPSPEIVTTFLSLFSPVDRVCRYVQTYSAVYCVLRSGKSHYIFADIHTKLHVSRLRLRPFVLLFTTVTRFLIFTYTN